MNMEDEAFGFLSMLFRPTFSWCQKNGLSLTSGGYINSKSAVVIILVTWNTP